ncbi:MAG: hypothetical protein AAF567_02970 [Actinomycetota bacterium]
MQLALPTKVAASRAVAAFADEPELRMPILAGRFGFPLADHGVPTTAEDDDPKPPAEDPLDDEVLSRVVEAEPAHSGAQERGAAVLETLPVRPASVGFTISFLPAETRFGGLMFPDTRHIEIYVGDDWSDARLAHVTAHEVGHAVDMIRNSRADHERWRAARGISPSVRWWADPYTSDFATPSGDFAECFAAWAVGVTSTRSQFGGCDGTAALMAELATS